MRRRKAWWRKEARAGSKSMSACRRRRLARITRPFIKFDSLIPSLHEAEWEAQWEAERGERRGEERGGKEEGDTGDAGDVVESATAVLAISSACPTACPVASPSSCLPPTTSSTPSSSSSSVAVVKASQVVVVRLKRTVESSVHSGVTSTSTGVTYDDRGDPYSIFLTILVIDKRNGVTYIL